MSTTSLAVGDRVTVSNRGSAVIVAMRSYRGGPAVFVRFDRDGHEQAFRAAAIAKESA